MTISTFASSYIDSLAIILEAKFLRLPSRSQSLILYLFTNVFKMSVPIIDISDIDNPESQLRIATEITEACKNWGFLLLKGHPIPPQDIEDMFKLSRDFFHLPEDEKTKWPINDKYIGYMGALSDLGKDDKMSMWLSGVPGALPANKSDLPPFWHEHLEKVEHFKHQCYALVTKMLVCFALAMGLPDRNYFAAAHHEDAGNGNGFRLLMYPAREKSPGDVTRMNAHTDSGSVTLLFQTSPGLEVATPDGGWINAPCIKDCILVNLGDALSFWSGKQLKATKHRVTFDGVPFDQERLSMAYFGSADPSTILEPLKKDGSVEMGAYNDNGITVYPGITAGEYRKLIMERIYGASVSKKAETTPTPVATAT